MLNENPEEKERLKTFLIALKTVFAEKNDSTTILIEAALKLFFNPVLQYDFLRMLRNYINSTLEERERDGDRIYDMVPPLYALYPMPQEPQDVFESSEYINMIVWSEQIVRFEKAISVKPVYIYFIDSSARILGVLAHRVFQHLGLEKEVNIRFYNLNIIDAINALSEKEKNNLRKTTAIVVDEYVEKGTQITAAQEFLNEYHERIIYCAFGGIRSPESKKYNIVSNNLPSWYGKSKYAGVEKQRKRIVDYVSVNKNNREFTITMRRMRRAIEQIAPMIAFFIKRL